MNSFIHSFLTVAGVKTNFREQRIPWTIFYSDFFPQHNQLIKAFNMKVFFRLFDVKKNSANKSIKNGIQSW